MNNHTNPEYIYDRKVKKTYSTIQELEKQIIELCKNCDKQKQKENH